MTSVALARKWRPKSFAALVGQDHVTTALIHSLEQSRLHHAYLFTGTRGVGKTTIARLFAKALNCEQGISATPCLHCDTCLAIDTGSYIDLIEIDAASNTRIEEIREILDNVPYAPTVGRYKVYLIDEVHMLSQHSFNALLKTLEEPPSHVKFLLATTDPQKLPATILSRCLQFYLRPISVACIAQQLKSILKAEGISYDEEEAIQLLAKSADGSMRDALSLLDQAIAAGQGRVNLSILASQLNLMETHDAEQIIDALALRDTSKLLEISERIACHGGNYEKVLQDLIAAFHQLALTQILAASSPLLENAQALVRYRDAFSAEELQLMYQIALKGSQDILIAPTLAIGFEMTLLRLHTFIPASSVKIPLEGAQPETHTQELHHPPSVQSVISDTSLNTLERVDNSSSEALSPTACSRDPEVLPNPQAYCTEIDSAGSREQVEEHRDIKYQQTLAISQEEPEENIAIDVSTEPPSVPIQEASIPTEFDDIEFSFDDLLPIDEISPPIPQPVIEASAQSISINDNVIDEPSVSLDKTRTTPLDTDWQTIIAHLKLTGLAHAALDHASLIAFDENELVLGVAASHRSLFTPAISKKIQQAVEDHYKINIKLTIKESNNTTPAEQKQYQKEEDRTKALEILDNDSALDTIKQVFSAEIYKDSVELLKDGI